LEAGVQEKGNDRMKLSLPPKLMEKLIRVPPKLVERLIGVPVISFCKVFITS
jgi:hypothetical protein